MLLEGLNQLLARTTRADVVCECRRCGTSVDEGTETCPACGAEAIVRHRIS